jgi:hypothetical protein
MTTKRLMPFAVLLCTAALTLGGCKGRSGEGGESGTAGPSTSTTPSTSTSPSTGSMGASPMASSPASAASQ